MRCSAMRTTINIDENLFKDLMHITDAPTKTEAVRIALSEYVNLKRKRNLLALRGNVDIEDNWQKLRQMDSEEINRG